MLQLGFGLVCSCPSSHRARGSNVCRHQLTVSLPVYLVSLWSNRIKLVSYLEIDLLEAIHGDTNRSDCSSSFVDCSNYNDNALAFPCLEIAKSCQFVLITKLDICWYNYLQMFICAFIFVFTCLHICLH